MRGLRISGGELRGRRIGSPPPGAEMRPTTERVREAVFSMLGEIAGARVLDLYCGTGALALEALSRGAAEATLVDTSPELARANADALGLGPRCDVVRSDAVAFLDRAPARSFDLVLCDPPYGLGPDDLSELDQRLPEVLAPGGCVMVESPTGAPPPAGRGLEPVRERAYGDSLVRIWRRGEDR